METHRTRGFTEGFWHSALCTTINLTSDGDNPLDIWNVHLNPHGEDQRLAEAERLRNMIGTSRLALIVGDFNSLSRSDAYDPEMINSLREKGVRKFGEDELRYDVTDFFTRQGFVDLAQKFDAATSTVPTPASKDHFHAEQLRLDYAMATPTLADLVVGIETIKTPETGTISDHYPTVLEIKL